MKKHFLSLFAATALLASCSDLKNPETKNEPQDATADTAVVYKNSEGPAPTIIDTDPDWTYNAADLQVVNDEESGLLPGVRILAAGRVRLYGLNDEVLFDVDKASLRPEATKALQDILNSIDKRYPNRDMRVYGHTDSTASAAYNKTLGRERADAVRNWLIEQGKVPESRITVKSLGQAQPIADNGTAAGRQENRRVEIAVLTK
ncbi:OmpA family protein [Hymenobacter profundi]|uniref:OmpA family protein n=1 Tax=Hymenobacter profundi TaxID=1982110 RepID=A0ABS6WWT9_9BACT|nr:OmpA family protein [Hymenobacter profundi]MBW3127956.1 OmpA family protein [Hymenobacter profundi]